MKEDEDSKHERPAFVRVTHGAAINGMDAKNNTLIGEADFLDNQGEITDAALRNNKHVIPHQSHVDDWHSTWWGGALITFSTGLAATLIAYFFFGVGRG